MVSKITWNPIPEEAFLQDIAIRLQCHSGTWKSVVNQALRNGHRPKWADHLFDTFTDHLFDTLRDLGILAVGDTRTSMAQHPARVPREWEQESNPERSRAIQEALRRAHLTYKPPMSAALSACA